MGVTVLLAKGKPPSQAGQGTIDLSPVKKWLLGLPGSRPTSRQLLLSTLFHVFSLHKHASSQLPLRDSGVAGGWWWGDHSSSQRRWWGGEGVAGASAGSEACLLGTEVILRVCYTVLRTHSPGLVGSHSYAHTKIEVSL